MFISPHVEGTYESQVIFAADKKSSTFKDQVLCGFAGPSTSCLVSSLSSLEDHQLMDLTFISVKNNRSACQR